MTDSEIAGRILGHLEQIGMSQENTIKRLTLRRLLEICDDIRIGDRRMRKIIEFHCPQVCFNGKGYYIAANKEEAVECATRLEHYIRGLAMRRRAVLSQFDTGVQLELGI